MATELPKRLRVLCIDDEPAVLEGISALLQRWGAEVGQARSIAEAQALGDGPWDVVLADHELGGEVTGLDYLIAGRNARTVYALVTAKSDDHTLARAAEHGVEVIRKPIAPASLRAFLTRASYAAGVDGSASGPVS